MGYEIDLSAEHQRTPYGAGKIHRPRPQGRRHIQASPRSRAASAIDTTAVRTWAREQGIDIKDRGRVPPTSSPNTRRPPGGKHPPAAPFREHYAGSGRHHGARLTTPTAGGAYRMTVEPRDAARPRLPISKRNLAPGHAGKQPPLNGAPGTLGSPDLGQDSRAIGGGAL